MALTHTPQADLGRICPEFALPGVDGRTYVRGDFIGADACLIMFICNHCPYVIAVEDRLIALGRAFPGRSFKMVGISANDSEKYPADSFENMKKRSQEKGYPFPYLHDESQSVAREFGAVCTPDFFLFDRDGRLAYRGRLDDSWKDPAQVREQELKKAIEALLDGRQPSAEQKPSMGCSIKWKPGNLPH